MSKLAPTLWIAAALAVAALLLIGWKTLEDADPSRAAAEEAESPTIVIKEAIVRGDVFRLTVLATEEGAKAAIELSITEPAESFAYLPDTTIIDPASIGAGIEPDIPYTYASELEKTSIYLATMISDGWSNIGTYRDAAYADLYLAKNGIVCRVIAMPDFMKVLYPVRSELPDPERFINGTT
ncbi:hypothetical protein [Cohnella sp. GCM10027633]|uniref:hypothetical protein n=1 Tax=unclassified Cohnella TaxID=2636738 RepID=UPI00363CE8E1